MTKPKLKLLNIARQLMWIYPMDEKIIIRNMTVVCLAVSLRLISLCEFAPMDQNLVFAVHFRKGPYYRSFYSRNTCLSNL